MICNHCGTQNKLGDKFCKKCGAPLQPQTPKTSEFKKSANKTTKPIIIAVAVVIVFFVLFVGREIPGLIKRSVTNTYGLGNYDIEIPSNYKLSSDTLTLVSDDFASGESVVLQVYSDSYENLVFNFQQLIDSNQMITSMKEEKIDNEEWLVAKYELNNYKGIIALKSAGGDETFWVQTMTTEYERGQEIIDDIIPMVNKIKTNDQEQTDETPSTSITRTLIEATK